MKKYVIVQKGVNKSTGEAFTVANAIVEYKHKETGLTLGFISDKDRLNLEGLDYELGQVINVEPTIIV